LIPARRRASASSSARLRASFSADRIASISAASSAARWASALTSYYDDDGDNRFIHDIWGLKDESAFARGKTIIPTEFGRIKGPYVAVCRIYRDFASEFDA
jgi:hypothetical protein